MIVSSIAARSIALWSSASEIGAGARAPTPDSLGSLLLVVFEFEV